MFGQSNEKQAQAYSIPTAT